MLKITTVAYSIIEQPQTVVCDVKYEEVIDYTNLLLAYKSAKHGKRNSREVREFEKDLAKNLMQLHNELKSGTYVPGAYRSMRIVEQGKEREISIAEFRDRIVHHAVCDAVEEWHMNAMSVNTHACLKGRGVHTALDQTKKYVRTYQYCLKIDIHHYFQTIDREVLKNQVHLLFSDQQLLQLIDSIIDTAPTSNGIPIGNYTSQFLANSYLRGFDMFFGHDYPYIRYMDDMVFFSNNKQELHALLKNIEDYLRLNLHLELNQKTQIFPVSARGVDYVGYRVTPDCVRLRKSLYYRMSARLEIVQNEYTYTGTIGLHNAQRVISYYGWAKHCSKSVRRSLYQTHFKQLVPVAKRTVSMYSQLQKNYETH